MSVENIAKRIIDEAQVDARSVSEKAEQEMAKLRSGLEQEERELREETKKKIEVEAEEIVKRRISSARLEVRKRILGQKDMIVGEVYSEAKGRILALSDEEYLNFLKKLVVSYSVGGDETVIFPTEDAARLKAKLPQWEKDVTRERKEKGITGSLSLSSETRDIEGGLVLSQGRTEINLGLDGILAETKYLLEGEVTDILFGSQS
jgi:V/A-type H+-transporting ATPase subunit E